MALSSGLIRRMLIALGASKEGNELANAVAGGAAQASQDLVCLPAAIVATSVSTTVDFAALAVGDKVLHIPTTAGNSSFMTVATAGTLPAAAVVGDMYLVTRAFSAPATTAFKL